MIINWDLLAPFYFDYFGISVVINLSDAGFKEMTSYISNELIDTTVVGPSNTNNFENKQSSNRSKNKKIVILNLIR